MRVWDPPQTLWRGTASPFTRKSIFTIQIKSLFAFGLLFLAVSPLLTPLPQWLDSTELTVAAGRLGIGHPPGQPLFSVLVYPLQWLPIGTLSLRIMLCQALLIPAVMYFIYGFLQSKLCKTANFTSGWLVVAFVCLSQPMLMQVNRQELYGLHLLLVFAAVWLLFSGERPQEFDRRHILLVGWLAGLAFANHTLLALITFAGIALGWRQGIGKKTALANGLLGWSAFFVVIGASVYCYLPLRAANLPPINFGDPSGWANFHWVLSGRLYESYDRFEFAMLVEHLREVVALIYDVATPLGFLTVLIGWFYLWRQARNATILLGIVALSSIASVLPNSTFDVGNPDLFGYLLVGLVIFFLYGSLGLIGMLRGWQARNLCSDKVAAWVGCAAAVIIVVLAMRNIERLKFMKHPETDRFALALNFSLPYGAQLNLGSYHTLHHLLYAQWMENVRPDLCLSYRGDPRGSAKLDNQSCTGNHFFELALDAHDSKRGIGVREPAQLLKRLTPHGWFFLVTDSQSESLDFTANYAAQRQYWQTWFAGLEQTQPDLRDRVSYGRLLQAIYYHQIGFARAAREEIEASRLGLQVTNLTSPES